jgi:hypothetical protein
MPYKIGDRVFDLISGQLATITAVHSLYSNSMVALEELDAMSDDQKTSYSLDNSIPLNPTKDGAFPTRGRLHFELDLPANRSQYTGQAPYCDY